MNTITATRPVTAADNSKHMHDHAVHKAKLLADFCADNGIESFEIMSKDGRGTLSWSKAGKKS